MSTFATFKEADTAVMHAPLWSQEMKDAIQAAIDLATTAAEAYIIWFPASEFDSLKIAAANKWASLCTTEEELEQITPHIPWHFDAAQVVREKLSQLNK